MNTGLTLETERLFLIPGSNARDDELFIQMLRKDGNFRDFCGIEFSEKYLENFRNYFERRGEGRCIYSIFPKNTNQFIGYVGFHREPNFDYEIEFYIKKSERRKGYCEEACRAVMNQFFAEGLSVDNNKLRGEKLYASTLTDNTATISLLSKLGFKRYVPEDGLILIMEGFFEEESDEFLGYCVSKYVIEKTD